MYRSSVTNEATPIFQLNLLTTEYTFKSSTIIKELNVIVTMFANDSLKYAIQENIIIPP